MAASAKTRKRLKALRKKYRLGEFRKAKRTKSRSGIVRRSAPQRRASYSDPIGKGSELLMPFAVTSRGTANLELQGDIAERMQR